MLRTHWPENDHISLIFRHCRQWRFFWPSIMTSKQLTCNVTQTWGTGIVTSYSSSLAYANLCKVGIHCWIATVNIDFLPPRIRDQLANRSVFQFTRTCSLLRCMYFLLSNSGAIECRCMSWVCCCQFMWCGPIQSRIFKEWISMKLPGGQSMAGPSNGSQLLLGVTCPRGLFY